MAGEFQSSPLIAEGRYGVPLFIWSDVTMFQSSPLIAEGRYVHGLEHRPLRLVSILAPHR